MSKNLVIVESPAKAKTIEKYLGGDFTVLSSIGHIRSIAKKVRGGGEPIDVKNGFATTYEIDPEKKKVIAELKRAVKTVGPANVWLATDEDREGEAIAWHLAEVLGLDPATTKRIVFHEITKPAITEAIQHPRTIDMNLVRAQQARQILDRIVGFELSPVVWQKVPGGKSAGRVQSPAVRLLVEREQEITAFEGSSQFRVTALFHHDGQEFKAELNQRFDTEAEATKFLESLADATFTVSDIKKSPSTRNPSAPFTTSTLQQEANAKLGFSSRATMTAAQKLYQDGKITYMRTDSVNLSGQAIAQATDYIKRLYGPEYSQVRKFKTKNASAQEAHEAIRPTDMTRETASNNEYDQKLYDLIRRRTLASQMSPAKLENTTVTIEIASSHPSSSSMASRRVSAGAPAPGATRAADISENESANGSTSANDGAVDSRAATFEAKGQVITFDGFLRVYGSNKEELLPPLHTNDQLGASDITARQMFAKPPARYTEGSLVKKLEDLGIGRPSTYATIIDTIQTRGYVEKGDSEGEPRDVVVLQLATTVEPGDASFSDISAARVAPGAGAPAETRREAMEDNDGIARRTVTRTVETEKTGSNKGKLVPTPAGELIASFLENHFEQVVDYDFTANVEEEFDRIAADKLDRNAMLKEFYTPFHALIENSGTIDRSTVGTNREVGIDPKSGRPIIARFGRFGPMLQLGATEDKDNKPEFAPLPRGAKLETVTLEQALEAFKLPRLLGQTADGLDIRANVGRFGPFLQVGTKTTKTKPLYVSLKQDDPHDITLERALILIDEKLKAEAEKNIADFGDGVKVLNGRFGPYITDGTKNAKIPKDTDPKEVTHEQALELLAAALVRKGRTRASAKPTKSRATSTKKPATRKPRTRSKS